LPALHGPLSSSYLLLLKEDSVTRAAAHFIDVAQEGELFICFSLLPRGEGYV
jgi:hypothetical protein